MMKYFLLISVILLGFLSFIVKTDAKDKTAALVFINGKVVTMDEKAPFADAVAVDGGYITAVGSIEDIKPYIKENTRVIDLRGMLLMPAFIESHAHYYSLGESLCNLNLVGTKSAEEIGALVKMKAKTTPPGSWIIGNGWDQNDWAVQEFPNHRLLDEAAADNPVLLYRIDGHAVWVNGKVLQIAGITKDAKNPDGGEIIRDTQGEPTGVLVDKATNLVSIHIPQPTPEEIEKYLVMAEKHCFSFGITSFQDMGITPKLLSSVKKMYKEGKLKVRLYEMIGAGDDGWIKEAEKGPQVGLYDGRLTIRGVKAYVDGAMGSRGALLFEPYSDRLNYTGLQVVPDKDLELYASVCKKYGLQLAIHAIGDKGNHKVLNLFEKIIGADPAEKYRWRIEHSQVLAPEDIPRFAKIGVVPSMQPVHCTSDMPWAGDRLGKKRIKGAYAWRSLLNTGVRIAGGSDAPVENINPIHGIYAALTRQDQEGNPPGGWQPEQRLTIDEALKMYTIWGAWVAFEENFKGKIKPGFAADLIILDKDITITALPPKEIPGAKVVKTFLAGEEVYTAQ